MTKRWSDKIQLPSPDWTPRILVRPILKPRCEKELTAVQETLEKWASAEVAKQGRYVVNGKYLGY